MPRVGDDDSIVCTDGGERCPEPDPPGSSRDFIDDSEGQVVGDGLRDYGGGSDSDTSIELLVLRVSRPRFNSRFGRAYGLHPAKL
jgi:hypothetical protein